MRKKLKNISISWKITLMYGGIFAIAVMVITSVMTVNAFIFYRNVLQNELTETVIVVGELISTGRYTGANAIEELNLSQHINLQIRDVTSIFTIDIMRMALRPPHVLLEFNAPAPVPAVAYRRGFFYLSNEEIFEYGGRIYFVRAYRDDNWPRQALGIFGFVFIILQTAGIAGAFTIGRYISKAMLRPVTDMIDMASKITIEDLGRRINVSGPTDEIGMLGLAFNDMIDRLEVSIKKQVQFISDASHELRTPISVIQGYANLLSRWGKNDPEILMESIESIKAETEHMGTLVKKLLFLAAHERQERAIILEKVSLNACLKEIVKDIQVLELQHTVKLDELTESFISGDAGLIKQAFWIFIENSMKYSKNGIVSIVICVYNENNENFVSISDDGIGIKKEDLPFIFDRFYRGDKSRSKEIPGTGLGLSIAARILAMHQAKVEVKSEWGKGSEVILRFPMCESEVPE